MKKILLIATGGTIASSESSEGLTPSIDVKTLLTYIPEIESICHLEGISVMRVDSTNMNPKLMARIAETIAQNYDAYDGFVIAHGTDTMAYSAAGITYMLKNLAKPVAFTSQSDEVTRIGMAYCLVFKSNAPIVFFTIMVTSCFLAVPDTFISSSNV